MLKDHRNACTNLTKFRLCQGRKILILYHNSSGGGLLQVVQATHQGRLSGTTHTDDAIDISLVDIQADALQGLYLIILTYKSFCYILDLNDRFHKFLHSRFALLRGEKRKFLEFLVPCHTF